MKTNTNTIQYAIRQISYSVMNTAQIDGKTYEFFKLDSDGYIYVLCVDTNRATRYNTEGQNGKRISMDAYLEACNTLESEAAIKELDDAAENPEVTLEQFVEMVDESEKTEEVKEIQKELAPKKDRKPRKSKDIAYTYYISDGKNARSEVAFTLTAKQVDFIRHLPDTCFWEEGLDSCIWVDCLCDDIGGQFAGKPMTVGAMISTLCEKNLGTRATCRRDNRKCTSFELTELGKQVAADLGLF